MKATHVQHAGNRKGGLTTSIVSGLITMIGIGAVTVLVFPMFVQKEYIGQNLIDALVVTIQIVSTMGGGIVAGAISQEKKWIVILIVAGIYYIALISAGMLLFDGISSNALVGLLGCVIGATVAILIHIRKKTKVKHKRKISRSR